MAAVKLWLPVLTCAGIIFFFSSLPAAKVPSLFAFQAVAYHFFVYLMLAFFFCRALRKSFLRVPAWKIYLFVVAFGIIYGVSDEFHQSFVPRRSVSGFDVFIDALGSLAGGMIYPLWKKSLL